MKLVLIACCLLLIQSALTAIQVRYYQKLMKALVGKYRGEKGYHLFSGQSRRRIGPGSIVLLVVDESYIIQECQCMRGVSILSTFKEMEEYEGMHLGELLDRLHTSEKKRKSPALQTALQAAGEQALTAISKMRRTTSIS
ncbi:transcriptional regulator GutM [Shouchella clausii]|uniref:transcriptional regulator GutM n=1 Tax=Shouchella clausii TaxID=79880 RepID=UPI000B9628F1|nr:transcriptional regulator GutM [Shouchella clausii]AST96558.1 transcriptional regulator [Shouchella clausii]MCR1289981.1 transcriptional regulator GutM [Shouchella clausii]MEB5474230.1 transcriptional regulator GutM [Shouchella clausii]PAD90233.1 transcriptional regulator [Shouchella clausii]QNM42915.1 transcriptional regulator [Shouchella clausii]